MKPFVIEIKHNGPERLWFCQHPGRPYLTMHESEAAEFKTICEAHAAFTNMTDFEILAGYEIKRREW